MNKRKYCTQRKAHKISLICIIYMDFTDTLHLSRFESHLRLELLVSRNMTSYYEKAESYKTIKHTAILYILI